MEGWIVIVLIAVALFAGLIIYDKRKFISGKLKKMSIPKIHKKEKPIKEKVKKEKPVKEKKQKPSKNKKQEEVKEEVIDYDTLVMEDNVVFGKEPELPVSDNQQNDAFSHTQEDEDIDLDELFEQLRQQENQSNGRFDVEIDEEFNMPNFDNFTNDDFDNFLENEFSYDDLSDNVRNTFDSIGIDKNLTGKELGEVIKNLPPEIKALIIGDVLKPKF